MEFCALGKLLFGRYKLALPPGSRIFFTETALKLPAEDMPYEELFYRAGDMIRLEAETGGTDRPLLRKVEVRLQPKQLRIGQDTFEPDKVLHLEAVADHVVLPREAMGLGGREIHGGDRRLFGLAGGAFFAGAQFGHRLDGWHGLDPSAQARLVGPSALRPVYRGGGGDLDFRRPPLALRAVPPFLILILRLAIAF